MNAAISQDAIQKKKPPYLAVVSLLLLFIAIGCFVFGGWQAGFGFLVFHWFFGLLAMIQRKTSKTHEPPTDDVPPTR